MIDINKKYFTNDGSEVIIYTTEAGGCFPVHAGVIRPGEKEMKMQVYDLEGKTPTLSDDLDLVLDEAYEPDKNEVVLFADPEDMMPIIGLYQHQDEDGFWGMVDCGNGYLEISCFDMMYSQIGRLDEAVGLFIKEKTRQDKDMRSISEEHASRIKEFAASLLGPNVSVSFKKV